MGQEGGRGSSGQPLPDGRGPEKAQTRESASRQAAVGNQAKRAKFGFIDSHCSEYGLAEMRSALKVARARATTRGRPARPAPTRGRDAELARLIGGAYEASRGICGSPKVHQVLRRQGVRTSRKRVARIMSEYGWRGTTGGNARRPRGAGKQAAHAPRVPNLVGRDFSAKGPNEAWFADITYVRTRQGWLHMAAVMDVWSRKAVG